jgi:hypothetical protein
MVLKFIGLNNMDKPRIAPDGTIRGDPIVGSNLYRTFCVSCGEPMRCGAGSLSLNSLCEQCGPRDDEFIDLRDLHQYPSQEGYARTDVTPDGSETPESSLFEKRIRRRY